MGFYDKKEITDKSSIRNKEIDVAQRLVKDIIYIAERDKVKIKSFTMSTLIEIKNDVLQSVEVIWWSYKMKLNVENVYLRVLEGLYN